jgi:hypothetical protein
MKATVFKSLDLPQQRIVLLEWSENKAHQYENLLCYALDGSLKWKAKLPRNGGADCFVDIALDGPELRANTWSGFALWLDTDTGQTLKSESVK